ncbi:MAG: sigma-54-dependent Fis family transcriptional regulator [Clostridia bacterium]|jgi:transcriptional regulator of acetoin/glycerol metabolism|nr:sigma-54-dependent Fis family transcriptional regulator [Clostridia bacterium]MDH7572289.1 sigma-54-dependent Fis family transcriptional regulator [Clostridia bacterium]
MGQNRVERVYRLWEAVVFRRGSPDTAARYVDPAIIQSWQRCLSRNLSPERPVAKRLDDGEIRARRKQYARLIEIARLFLERLYHLVTGSGFVVVLLDREACILELMGDEEILNRDYYFRVGEFWDEESKGTNAMGLAKVEQKHVQVYATEHYCRANHWLTCSAAPIRNEDGEMIGILDVSGDYRRAHAHTLGMVVAAVQAIENHLRLEAAGAEISRSYSNIAAIVEAISDGLVSFDHHGSVTMVNHVAARMLGVTVADCLGQPLDKMLNLPTATIRNIIEGQQVLTDQEIFVDTGRGPMYFLMSGRPILDGEQKVCGGVVTLRPMGSVHRLITKMVGASARFTFEDILGSSPSIRRAIQAAKSVARSTSTVLLEGESGTGKEMFAQAIHNASPVAAGPFVAINCGAIPRELVESELFGYEEGAFTGARRGGRPGKFELANGGTVFLDEVGDMPWETQAALLRVLQEKQVVRVGGLKPIPVTIRVIAATNRDLKKEVEKGNFRGDLYYRLNVVSIRVPPLRERREDIALLVQHFIQKFSALLRMPPNEIDPAVLDIFYLYSWPGNVRELSNLIERAVNLAQGKPIAVEHLPDYLQAMLKAGGTANLTVPHLPEAAFYRQQRQLIVETLETVEGNIAKCSRVLGISRSTLYRKLKRYGISVPRKIM